MLNEIDTLNCMTVADFEGMTVGVRHVLANMVQRYFADLSGWDTEVEQGSEYGGLFPITVILMVRKLNRPFLGFLTMNRGEKDPQVVEYWVR